MLIINCILKYLFKHKYDTFKETIPNINRHIDFLQIDIEIIGVNIYCTFYIQLNSNHYNYAIFNFNKNNFTLVQRWSNVTVTVI